MQYREDEKREKKALSLSLFCCSVCVCIYIYIYIFKSIYMMRFKKCVSFFCVFFAMMMMMRVSVGSARSTRSGTRLPPLRNRFFFFDDETDGKEKSSFEDFQEERRRKRGKTLMMMWLFCSFVLSSLLSFLSAIVVFRLFIIYSQNTRGCGFNERRTT